MGGKFSLMWKRSPPHHHWRLIGVDVLEALMIYDAILTGSGRGAFCDEGLGISIKRSNLLIRARVASFARVSRLLSSTALKSGISCQQ